MKNIQTLMVVGYHAKCLPEPLGEVLGFNVKDTLWRGGARNQIPNPEISGQPAPPLQNNSKKHLTLKN